MTTGDEEIIVRSLERPHPDLLKYYFLRSLLLGPFFLIAFVPSLFRYRTLRYRFDNEGVSMRWGLLFHREITLTYPRIQDIHLASNAVERAFGLGRIQIQTASGASTAEITVEGLHEFEVVRDFLYSHMRGARAGRPAAVATSASNAAPAAGDQQELTPILEAIADELAALRRELGSRPGAGTEEDR